MVVEGAQPNLEDLQFEMKNGKPYIIGICGGTNTGKTEFCNDVVSKLIEKNGSDISITIISQESFYRELETEEIELANHGEYNFDHPNAIDKDAIVKMLTKFKKGYSEHVPVYDFRSHINTGEMELVKPCEVILLEGILMLNFKEIREMLDMKIFLEIDSDTRLTRRIEKDMYERGRDLESIINQYTRFVKPMYDDFCYPSRQFADIIVPRGVENRVAVDLLFEHIQDILQRSPAERHDSQYLVRSSSVGKKRPH